ncbi:MAG: hypothetical protein ACK55I_10515, partial [bacterium]
MAVSFCSTECTARLVRLNPRLHQKRNQRLDLAAQVCPQRLGCGLGFRNSRHAHLLETRARVGIGHRFFHAVGQLFDHGLGGAFWRVHA